MYRSILLRGFDQDIAGMIGDHMRDHTGVKFAPRATPTSIVTIEGEGEDGGPTKYRVTWTDGEGAEQCEEFDGVLSAVGRDADTGRLGLAQIGVAVDEGDGKVLCKNEQTSVGNVHAIGDVVKGAPELTPVAIKAGQLLARRLFGGSSQQMDYDTICTTVFTPIE